MTKDTALNLALEALEYPGPSWIEARQPAITAIKQALATPVQDMPKIGCVNHDCDKCKAAARRGWVGLTRWEIDAKLKEKK